MDILGLTTTEAIRATLGVSEDSLELPDTVFENHEIEDEIELNLVSWLPVDMMAILSGSDQLAIKRLRACAKYIGALLLLPSLTTSTASKQSDGQDEFQRQPRDLALMKDNLEELLARYQTALVDSLVATPTTVFSIMGRSSPSYDPVTGLTS